MSKTEIIPTNRIQQALVKANITDQVLQELRVHFNLTVKDEDDKQGYALVHDARMQCKDLRILATKIAKAGREDAIKEQKAWIAEEKRVVGLIEDIETHLERQEAIVDDAKKRKEEEARFKAEQEKAETERRARERFEQRANALMKVGVFRSVLEIANMIDSDFDQLLKEGTEKHQAELARREETEKAHKAEEARLADEKKKQDEERARLDEQKRKQDLEDAKREAEERGRKQAEEKAERERRERLGLERMKQINDLVPRKVTLTQMVELSEDEYCKLFDATTEQANQIKADKEAEEKAEALRLEALKPDKEKLKTFAQQIEAMSPPMVTTDEAKEILARASTLIIEAIEILTE